MLKLEWFALNLEIKDLIIDKAKNGLTLDCQSKLTFHMESINAVCFQGSQIATYDEIKYTIKYKEFDPSVHMQK